MKTTATPAKPVKQAKRPSGFHIFDSDGLPQRPSTWGGGRYLEPAPKPHRFVGQLATLRRVGRMDTLRQKLETSLLREAPQIREMAEAIRHAQPYQIMPIGTEGAA